MKPTFERVKELFDYDQNEVELGKQMLGNMMGEYAEIRDQLATVTAERDELRKQSHTGESLVEADLRLLDEVRKLLGASGERETSLRGLLSECERDREIDEQRSADLMTQVAEIAKERDELLEALKLADYIINGSDRIGGLLCCMDGYYAGVMDEELAQFDAVFAKFNDDKTGDVS